MRTSFAVIALTIVFSIAPWGSALADTDSSTPTLPIEHFFSNTLYTDVEISTDGTYYAIRSDAGDRDQVFVLRRSDNQVTASFDMGKYQRIQDIQWVNDKRFIFTSRKRVGFLDTRPKPPNLYAVNADGTERRELFEWGTSAFSLLSILPNDPEHIMINKYHWSEQDTAKAHRLNVYNGRSHYMGKQPPEGERLIADNNGHLRLSVAYHEAGDDEYGKGEMRIYHRRAEADKWQRLDIEQYQSGKTLTPLGFSPDNRYAYFAADFSGDVAEVYQLDTQTLTLEPITEDSVSDVYQAVHGINGGVIAFDFMPGRIERTYLQDTATTLIKSLDQAFAGQRVTITSSAQQGRLAVVYVRSDINPGEYYLFDTQTLEASFIAAPKAKLDSRHMAESLPFSFTARDGVTIHGYLTLPPGVEKGDKPPLVVNPHGGPHGIHDTWRFDTETQFLANRGFAVLKVNFRGSGGYGKAFERAGYRQWGRAMQDDITDATLWAVNNGYADRERICIYGGSYGGYAAMMGVSKEPTLYQCGVGYVGVYSLPLMFEEGDIPTHTHGRKYLERALGTDQQTLKDNSPAYLADNIKADILLVHGGSDIRVPIEQMEALTAALDKLDKPYQTLVKEDEGHGFQKPENKFAFYQRLVEFFDRHIGD